MSQVRKNNIREKNGIALEISDEKYYSLSSFEEELLTVLLGQEMYGLQICDLFEKASNGKRKIKISTLYPALNRLEQRELITSRMADRPKDSRGGARRKYFKISRKGAFVLAQRNQFLENLNRPQPAPA